MSEKLKVVGVDLTTMGDVPLPEDRTHPVFNYPQPLDTPSTDIPYAMLVMMVHSMAARIEALEKCVSNLANNDQLEGSPNGNSYAGSYSGGYRECG